ncbi:hypothetical protein [Streptomyces sp. ST2-7A]|uniref:hypothetical protein n=1 Tax=Streptomyces sp. ST2-7A TaxID=2907214 RepID=UPI001F2F45A2|nr:hypothetical protein [Streptomyces sp. ST2-7A]MCE7081692.1 hypothetical protein [Streptomyces sp. ST2-7A]
MNESNAFDGDLSWAYVLRPTGIEVIHLTGHGPARGRVVDWDRDPRTRFSDAPRAWRPPSPPPPGKDHVPTPSRKTSEPSAGSTVVEKQLGFSIDELVTRHETHDPLRKIARMVISAADDLDTTDHLLLEEAERLREALARLVDGRLEVTVLGNGDILHNAARVNTLAVRHREQRRHLHGLTWLYTRSARPSPAPGTTRPAVATPVPPTLPVPAQPPSPRPGGR